MGDRYENKLQDRRDEKGGQLGHYVKYVIGEVGNLVAYLLCNYEKTARKASRAIFVIRDVIER